MEFQNAYIESKYYRCIEYRQGLSEDLYLMLCGIEQCIPGKTFGSAKRAGYHMHIVVKGKGTLIVNERQENVKAGQIFITKPEEETKYCADRIEPWSYGWITFDGNRSKEYVEAAGFTDGVNVLDCNIETSRFIVLMQQMLDRPQLNLSSDLYRMGIVYQLIALAVESHYKTQQRTEHYHHFTPDDYVDYVMNFINRNYATVRVSDLADNIGISREYLASIFKKKNGISPREYILDKRLSKSCELLDSTELSVKEIALKVGYDNALTFSKMFKRKYGISPKYYREKGIRKLLS